MGLKPGSGGRSSKDMSEDLARVATISIDGQVLPLHSWSMSGFRCGGYSGYLRPGQKTGVRIIIPTGDGPQSFEMPADLSLEKATASYAKGILTVEIPHREEMQKRQIAVHSS